MVIEIHVEAAPKPASEAEPDVLVALISTAGELSRHAAELDASTSGAVKRAIGIAGKLDGGQVVELIAPHGIAQSRLLLLALPTGEETKTLDIEHAGGSLATALAARKVKSASVASAAGLATTHPATETAALLATGAMLRSYDFRKYRTTSEDNGASTLRSLSFSALDGDAEGLFEAVRIQVNGTVIARDLVSEPGNVLYPESFAERCRELESLGVGVEILDEAKLRALKMNALLGVGQGSARPPYVVVMRWRGDADAKQPLALVGKGVCFDTGGISLKPGAGMEEMKWDMGGAAAVVGAMHAIAGRRAKADVVGVIGLAENMPSGTAQRPGDVVKAMSGKTIEVINTDAEGRLMLADVLWYTQDRFKPRAIIDLATLTGAVIIALGHENAGLFANNDELADQILKVGEEVGETLWRLPISKAYSKHIKSPIADIKNVGRAREAGSTAGAVFLEHFVNGLPWAHLDIAGMAWTSRDLPLAGKGGTGFGARLLDRLVARHYES